MSLNWVWASQLTHCDDRHFLSEFNPTMNVIRTNQRLSNSHCIIISHCIKFSIRFQPQSRQIIIHESVSPTILHNLPHRWNRNLIGAALMIPRGPTSYIIIWVNFSLTEFSPLWPIIITHTRLERLLPSMVLSLPLTTRSIFPPIQQIPLPSTSV